MGVSLPRDAAWLRDGKIARLLAMLDRDGEEARVVGGAAHNMLLRLPLAEIDVSTTAMLEEVAPRPNSRWAGGRPASSTSQPTSRYFVPHIVCR
jgi:tRNA nucleotidyltransferase/poly(A) polymerase